MRAKFKNPWYHVFTGDIWKKKYAHDFYRFRVYTMGGEKMARVTHCEFVGDMGRIVLDGFQNLVGPQFKKLALERQLEPQKRANKLRNGQQLQLWDWPEKYDELCQAKNAKPSKCKTLRT